MSAAYGQVAVVAHKSVPVKQLSKSELFDIYAGETQLWEGDLPIQVYDLKSQEDTKKMFYRFIGKSISRMKSIWMVNMLSGEGDPPKTVVNEEEMIKLILETPGAIGYLPKALVHDSLNVLLLIE